MRQKYFFTGLLFLFFVSTAYSQDAKFKALFMYNFTKYLEWPVEKQKGEFIIGVYGSSPIIQELTIIAQKKKVGSQPIKIRQVGTYTEMKGCNILYVPENRSAKIEEIVSNCTGKGTVLITDKEGFGKTYAGLNYVKINGKQSFEVNKTNLEKMGVKVNSVLLSLGIIVD
jgi:hypothetical protein